MNPQSLRANAWVPMGTSVIKVDAGTVIHDDQGKPHTVDDEHVIFKGGCLHVTDKVWEAIRARIPERDRFMTLDEALAENFKRPTEKP